MVDDLKKALRRTDTWYRYCMAFAVLNVLFIVHGLWNREATSSLLIYALSIVIGLAVGLVHRTAGSAALMNAVHSIKPAPTPECVSLLACSMRYAWVRKAAASKVVQVIPLLRAEDAGALEASHRTSLYAYFARGPHQTVQNAFDLALLTEDVHAVPHLQHALSRDDIPVAERDRMRQSAAELLAKGRC